MNQDVTNLYAKRDIRSIISSYYALKDKSSSSKHGNFKWYCAGNDYLALMLLTDLDYVKAGYKDTGSSADRRIIAWLKSDYANILKVKDFSTYCLKMYTNRPKHSNSVSHLLMRTDWHSLGNAPSNLGISDEHYLCSKFLLGQVTTFAQAMAVRKAFDSATASRLASNFNLPVDYFKAYQVCLAVV